MRTENEDEQGVHSELIRGLLSVADRLASAPMYGDSELGEIIAVWWQREAHLAIERAAHALDAGVPAETAWFLAVDDPGFQLAKAAADRYYTT